MKKSVAVMVAVMAFLTSPCGAQEVQDQGTPDAAPVVTKYDKLQKTELREELKRLQKEVLFAEHTAEQAREEMGEAFSTYKSTSEDLKADALLRMIEAEANYRQPRDNCAQVNSDFNAAKRAYRNLLLAEQK